MSLLARWRVEAEAWCRGRNPWVRLPLLAWGAYVLVRHLGDGEYWSLFGWINLGIHELGHVLATPLGQFLALAAGSALQCLVPVISLFVFRRQGDFFAMAFSFGWLSTNLFSVATYAADARAQELDLVSIGGGPVFHDWHEILNALGLLEQDAAIAFLLRAVATLSMLVFLAAGAWMAWRMIRSPGEPSAN